MSMVITRRSATMGIAAAGAFARAARGDPLALADAARREGSLTWYVAQLDTATAERFGRAFTAEYPGIVVEVIRTTGQVAFQRLMLDIKNRTPHCDVFSATDISHMPIRRSDRR
jgi:iron(III) transport system substrate-binding protein